MLYDKYDYDTKKASCRVPYSPVVYKRVWRESRRIIIAGNRLRNLLWYGVSVRVSVLLDITLDSGRQFVSPTESRLHLSGSETHVRVQFGWIRSERKREFALCRLWYRIVSTRVTLSEIGDRHYKWMSKSFVWTYYDRCVFVVAVVTTYCVVLWWSVDVTLCMTQRIRKCILYYKWL